jgi:diguanylate cyclase (GGDEF)-like protein
VLLGFGLVAAFCVIVIGTEMFFELGRESRWAVAAILGVTAALDLGLLVLLRRWPTRPMLLGFPVLLVLSELALALLPIAGGAVSYAGFITLAFVYIGLTQARGVGLLFTVLAGPVWVLLERPWSAEVGVKLFLALAVWVLISEVLAARTERARARTRRLVAQANTDVLTGLGSRLFLSDHIERVAGEEAVPGSALLFVNIDGFKVINDTYGHSAGDELLVVVARRLQALLRPGDLVARLSGDEFAALIDGCTVGQAESLARRMLGILGAPYQLSRGRVAITASIGIVEIESPTTAEIILRNADRAMREAKAAGRNRLSIYEDAMLERTVMRLELETELRDALDGDQFEVHYQPVVHTGTGAIVGAEALMRWRHPQRGLLAPDQFLAVSEEMGLMNPLGDWILRQACHQAYAWQSIDPSRVITIAVNLSAPEMFSADLIGRVESALEASGLPGKLLVLEITERIMMADSEKAIRQLGQLRKLGVRIAIDDFGTGYSSLAYLRDLPIDILKVDRSFVTSLGSDHQALALVKAIVGIADALDLDVIVEGAETAAQIELLGELGCQVVQGFYYGRPTGAEEFANRLSWSQASDASRRRVDSRGVSGRKGGTSGPEGRGALGTGDGAVERSWRPDQ